MTHLQSCLSVTSQHKLLVSALFLVVTMGASADTKVEKCTNNLGTLSVFEPKTGYSHLTAYGLGSPTALLRLMIQESGCFDVVERGVAMESLQQERAFAASGDLQQNSNVGKGQMQAADFVLTADVQATGNTGGVGGVIAGVGRMFGSVGAAIGAVAGGLKFKEANTSILIADVRSGIQVASAQGKAKKTDFSIGGLGYGAGSFGAGGGYTNTPEGKMIAASLLDNYNQIVQQVRDKPQLIKSRSEASAQNAANSIQAKSVPDAPPAPAPAMVTPPPAKIVVVQAPVVSTSDYSQLRAKVKVPVEFVGEYRCMLSGPVVGRLIVLVNERGELRGGGNLSGSAQPTQLLGDINAKGEFMASFTNPTTGGNMIGKVDANIKLGGTYKLATHTANAADSGTFECMHL